MKILIIEDEANIVQLIRLYLEQAGFTVLAASDGAAGLELHAREHPDLVILDLMLPKMDGIEVARKLRAVGKATPILMLTARDTEKDKIRGLDVGADDYLTKPFSFGEFLARVRALLRRDTLTRASVMRLGDLELDTAARQVRRGGQDVALSAREYALLEYLVHHAGQILTREQLAAHVWSDTEVESNVIDVYVRYLRQKVDAPFGEPLIHTVRGIGYTLRAP